MREMREKWKNRIGAFVCQFVGIVPSHLHRENPLKILSFYWLQFINIQSTYKFGLQRENVIGMIAGRLKSDVIRKRILASYQISLTCPREQRSMSPPGDSGGRSPYRCDRQRWTGEIYKERERERERNNGRTHLLTAAYLSSSPFFLSIWLITAAVSGPSGSCPGTREVYSSASGCPVLTKASANLRLRLAEEGTDD